MNRKEKQSHESQNKQREEIRLVKEYLKRCSSVPSSSLAIRVAIRALDEEVKKLDRDDKLRLKFAKGYYEADDNLGKWVQTEKNKKEEEEEEEMINQDNVNRTLGTVSRNTKDSSISNNKTKLGIDDMDYNMEELGHVKQDDLEFHDWQNIGPQDQQQQYYDDDQHLKDSSYTSTTCSTSHTSSLGVKLVRAALVEMSQAGTKVSTPTAALALILHSALVSQQVGFKCTGIPDDIVCCFKTDDDYEQRQEKKGGKKIKGFASPIRELPRGVFVPDNWDRHASLWRRNGDHDRKSLPSSSLLLSSSSSSSSQSQLHQVVVLRYSKIGMPATVLRVEMMSTANEQDKDKEITTNNGPQQQQQQHQHGSGDMVQVSFGPLGGEPCQLAFPIQQHINVDGLQSALLNNNNNKQRQATHQPQSLGVSPSLHYKALVKLMTDFCNVADLGAIDDGGSRNAESDRIAEHYTKNSIPTTFLMEQQQQREQTLLEATKRPPTILQEDIQSDDALRRRFDSPPIGGDFPDDLLPSGIPVPGFADADPLRIGSNGDGMRGNLMGPNHPMFRSPHFGRNEDDGNGGNDYCDEHGNDFITPGGLGMQPRFDPYYPPGIGGGRFPMPGGRFGRGRGRGRRGGGRYYGGGDPNPDHQRPPNTFGNGNGGGGGSDSMFM